MCSKLYADGELVATPYETDKVLRHRELCMGLNVLYAKKNHDYGDSFHQTYIEVRDTLLDLANYSIMTVLEIDDAQHEQEIAEQKTCDEGASDAD